MPLANIVVHGARQHNLRGLTISFPRAALTVVTGPSGSGKSSLAFDTLYAEGQRRYVESLSTYAKQFLERMAKPAVDFVDGISPAVAIEQKNPTVSSRSTVGTATEVYDYLRLLWARIGKPHCPACGAPVTTDSPTTATDRLLEAYADERALVTFPLPRSTRASHQTVIENLQALGFVRVVLDGAVVRIDEVPAGGHQLEGPVLVVVDRIACTVRHRARLADSLATAFAEGEGHAEVVLAGTSVRFSEHPRCVACGTPSLPPSPALFSFNSPRGACPACNGFGAVLEYDERLIVPDPTRTLKDGALDPWEKPRYTRKRSLLRETARGEDIPMNVPWERLSAPQRRFLLHQKRGRFTGVIPFLRALERKKYKQYIRVFLRQYQLAKTCPACNGARLRPEALGYRIGEQTIAQVSAQTAEELLTWLAGLSLSRFESGIAATILREIEDRVSFLRDVGLGYLTLDRQTRTLSGGEAQRISLSNALGSRLVDTLYVLDEPSIGLHPRDVGRLLDLLLRLRANGNTVVVVEHDPATIQAADYMVELGPGAGEHGGELVYAGPPAGAAAAGTLTGAYLSGAKQLPVPSARRRAGPQWLAIRGARLHNLHGVDVAIPLNTLTAVTGVSGSGKSTLVHDVVYHHLTARLKGRHGAKEHLGEVVGAIEEMDGWERFTEVVLIDQSPIGRSPRSNPVTYVRAFDDIRELFAQQPLSKARGYSPGTFSFNVDGGRCRACEGAGHVQIEMVFLADVFVPCEACEGTRYEPEVLDVRVKGLSIHDVLQLTVEEAMRRFRHQERLGKALWHLQQVGLGYLRLGQPGTTLSGGEAQRLKIARRLAGAGKKRGRTLYILDEPTTGLHMDDVRTLVNVLDRLVDAGNTVLVIEHNLDLIKCGDWVIDMGPEGGDAGGRVVASGTPEQVAASETHTGAALRGVLESAAKRAAAEQRSVV
ncbi:MAG TPA: excinuclease ABC subunit UvrA [Gemmatimonadales bacterium]|jgi:excinuclease ABC subunit A